MSLLESLKKTETQDKLVFLVLAICMAAPFIQPFGLPLEISQPTRVCYETVQNLPKGSVVVADTDMPLGNWYELGPGEIAFFNHVFALARERGLKFVMLSTMSNPDGQVIQDKIVESYSDKTGLKYGEDYVRLGWNPAYETAQSGVVRDLHKTFPVDKFGTPIGNIPMMKNIRDIKNINLLYFSTGANADPYMRQWSELATANKVPILCNLMSGQIASVVPYVRNRQLTSYINSSVGAAEYEKLRGVKGMGLALMDAMSSAHFYAITLIFAGAILFATRRMRRAR